MAWAKTALAHITTLDELRAEYTKVLAERQAEAAALGDEAMKRLIRIDCEINVILYSQWKTNCEGLRRIGIDASAYENAGPVTYGSPVGVPGRSRAVRPDQARR